MDIKRLLIADASAAFTDELTRQLGGAFQVLVCNDGASAQAMLEQFQPDVLLVDLMLPYTDGLALIQQASDAPSQPAILATTRIMTSFVEYTLQHVHIDYLMYKPCDIGVLTDRIFEICGIRRRDIFMPMGLHSTITDMLTTLNIGVNRKGFDFLQYGIEMFSQNPGLSMTKVLYPEIGRRFGIRASAVERDIRLAIEAAWTSQDPTIWRLYFSSDAHGCVPRPTNTIFISTLARRLRQLRQAI